MTIEEWLSRAVARLEEAGIGTARLDALVLAEDATGKDRAYLLAHPELLVRGSTSHKLNEQIERRIKHEPLAYIRGRTEFYGREFIVDRRVLEPRPESETMIEILCHLDRSGKISTRFLDSARNDIVIADIGTGSGALAITAKLEIPDAKVSAVDIDPDCLAVAKKNAKKHSVDIDFHKGNLLGPLQDPSSKISVLLCNLPYVPDNYQINQAAGNEPGIAIFGGPDGLGLYRKLFLQIAKNLQFKRSIKYILTESLPFQHEELIKIAWGYGYKQTAGEDFIQLFKSSAA